MLELDGERRDSQFILIWALDHDRVIALCPVDVSLLVGLIMLCCLLLQGCPRPLFISIEKAVVRLLGSKEGVLNYIQKLLSI
jgi:hypothetical protein